MRDRFLPLRRVLLLVTAATLALVAPVCFGSADVAAAPTQAKAKPSPVVRTATVELIEHLPKKKPQSSRYQLALSRDGRRSQVSSDDGVIRTTITVRQVDREQSAPLLHVELERIERRGRNEHGPARRSGVDITGRVKPGQGVILGQIARPGGGRLDVRLSLSR